MRLDFHHHHHVEARCEVMRRLDALDQKIDLILRNQEIMMPTLDQVLQDVTDESTQIDGIATLVSGLRQQVKDALANSSISPADQSKIDQIFATAEANKQKIANALAAPGDGSSAPASSTP
jgi:uncharacterized protein YoxC